MIGTGGLVERLAVIIEGHASSFVKMMKQSTDQIDKFSAKATKVGKQLSARLTVPITAAASASIFAFGQFDKKMTESVSIMAGVTDEIRARMADTAKSLSTQGTQSAAQLAESYFFLASAGLNAEQSIAALPVVQKFATAGAFDMALATDLLTDAQTALGLSSTDTAENMKNMARVSDVLAKATTQSNASIQQFAESLTNDAATAASGASQELESVVAILDAYAAKGKKGAEAGSLYGRALRLIRGSALENAKEFKKMNIQVFDAEGNMRNMIDIVGDMERAFAGMSDEQRATSLETLGFATLAQKSITPLLGMTEQMREWESQLKAAGGTTSMVANKQMKGFANQIAITKNRLQVLSIEIGEILAPSVLKFNERLSKGIEWVRSWNKETKVLAVQIAKVAAVIGPALVTFGTVAPIVVRATSMLTKMVTQLGGVVKLLKFIGPLAAVLNPWTIGIAAVVAAVGGLAYWLAGPEGIASAWKKSTEAVSWFVDRSIGFLQNFQTNFSALTTWIGNNWKGLITDLIVAWFTYQKNMISNVMVAVSTLVRLWSAFTGWLTIALPAAYELVFSRELWKVVMSGAKGVLKLMQPLAVGIVDIFNASFAGLVSLFSETLQAMFSLSVTFAEKIGSVMMALIKGEIPNPAELIAEFAAEAAAKAKEVAKATGEAVVKAAGETGKLLTAAGEQLSEDFNKGAGDLNFFNTAKDIINEGISEMKGPLDGFQSSIEDMPKFVFDRAKDSVEAAAGEVAQGVEGINNATVGAANQAAKSTEESAEAATDAVKGMANDVIASTKGVQGTLANSTEAFAKIGEFFSSAITSANNVAPNASSPTPAASSKVNTVSAGSESGSRKGMTTYLMKIEENTRPLKSVTTVEL